MCGVFLFMVGIPADHLFVAFEMNFVLGVPSAALRSGFSLQVLVPLPAALRAFRCNPSRGHSSSNIILANKHHIAVIPAQAGISLFILAVGDNYKRGEKEWLVAEHQPKGKFILLNIVSPVVRVTSKHSN